VRTIAGTDLDVFELCLGTNIFGWTADQDESAAVLDAYVAGGGNFIDTADSYSRWVEGHAGGESETVIGRWLATRDDRDELVIATKAGQLGGLDSANINRRVEDSLRRLQIDHIDLYYAHRDDLETPLHETLTALDGLVRAGKVRYIAASNYEPERLAEALAISEREGLARFVALSPHYNLLERSYETTHAGLLTEHGLSCLPYFALAKGFLTGKYRPGQAAGSDRGRLDGSAYLDEHGLRVLGALDEIAAAHGTTPAAVALAWLLAQPTVATPIASARTTEQLIDLMPMAQLTLTGAELELLDDVSAAAPA
jgi:aryl-alcohol dehydrogenase-like predicted oxidoreductase